MSEAVYEKPPMQLQHAHHYSSDCFAITLGSGISRIHALSGRFIIIINSGLSVLRIKLCECIINVNGGICKIRIEKGISTVNATSGHLDISTGIGYTTINPGASACDIHTKPGIGTTKIVLGSGRITLNGKPFLTWTDPIAFIEKYRSGSYQPSTACPHEYGSIFVQGKGFVHNYKDQIDTKQNRCYINGHLFVNGVKIKTTTTSLLHKGLLLGPLPSSNSLPAIPKGKSKDRVRPIGPKSSQMHLESHIEKAKKSSLKSVEELRNERRNSSSAKWKTDREKGLTIRRNCCFGALQNKKPND